MCTTDIDDDEVDSTNKSAAYNVRTVKKYLRNGPTTNFNFFGEEDPFSVSAEDRLSLLDTSSAYYNCFYKHSNDHHHHTTTSTATTTEDDATGVSSGKKQLSLFQQRRQQPLQLKSNDFIVCDDHPVLCTVVLNSNISSIISNLSSSDFVKKDLEQTGDELKTIRTTHSSSTVTTVVSPIALAFLTAVSSCFVGYVYISIQH